MPFQNELGTVTEGKFDIGTQLATFYAANDASRPLRYYVDAFGFVQLSGFIRRTGATSNLAAGGRTPICGPLPRDAYPPGAGFKDLLIRGSEISQAFGLSIISAAETVGGILMPRGSLIAITPDAITLTQNASWWSLDGITYRI